LGKEESILKFEGEEAKENLSKALADYRRRQKKGDEYTKQESQVMGRLVRWKLREAAGFAL